MAEEVVVIEKIIAKESLTKEMIEAGANVLRHLNKANFNVQAALWIYPVGIKFLASCFSLARTRKRWTAKKLYENTAHPLPDSRHPTPFDFIRYQGIRDQSWFDCCIAKSE